MKIPCNRCYESYSTYVARAMVQPLPTALRDRNKRNPLFEAVKSNFNQMHNEYPRLHFVPLLEV
jgi:hypothetical protein